PQFPQGPQHQAPHGQAPYGQAPYGQAPQGQAPQGQAPQYQGGPVPEAPKKKSVLTRIDGYYAGLDVAGLVLYGFNYFTSDAAQTKAGDCASVTGTATKPEYKTVDCGAAEANYTVGKVLDSTSASCGGDGVYDEYTETARRGPDSKLCLMPNFVEGKCYELTSSTTQMGYPPVDCGQPQVFELVKAVKGSADGSACGDATPLVYDEPKTTFCFGEPVSA
ncbi:hypothetical protein K7G98_32910, partial [Saccharothrix sp. MB29]|nr:hypothetical protein [Saccharothrix sp. MB29]